MRYHLHEVVDIGSRTAKSTSWVIYEIEKVKNVFFSNLLNF